MKYTFTVILKGESAGALLPRFTRFEIPKFNMAVNISPQHLKKIEELGYVSVLEKFTHAIVVKKEQEGESLASQGSMDDTLENLFDKTDKKLKMGKFDLPLKITVEYEPQRKWQFGSKMLPMLTKISIAVELAAGAVLSIGTLELSQGFLRLSNKDAESLAIAETVFSTIFGAWLAFTGPGLAFMKDLGGKLDEKMYNLYQKVTCKPNERLIEKSLIVQLVDDPWDKIRVSRMLTKAFFVFLALNNMWQDANADLVQAQLLRGGILEQDGQIFPPLLIIICSWVQLGFNQPNDLIQYISLIYMGLSVLDIFFNNLRTVNQDHDYEKSESAHWLDDDADPIVRDFYTLVDGDCELERVPDWKPSAEVQPYVPSGYLPLTDSASAGYRRLSFNAAPQQVVSLETLAERKAQLSAPLLG